MLQHRLPMHLTLAGQIGAARLRRRRLGCSAIHHGIAALRAARAIKYFTVRSQPCRLAQHSYEVSEDNHGMPLVLSVVMNFCVLLAGAVALHRPAAAERHQLGGDRCPPIPKGAFLGRLEFLSWSSTPTSIISRFLAAATRLEHLSINVCIKNIWQCSAAVKAMPRLRQLQLGCGNKSGTTSATC